MPLAWAQMAELVDALASGASIRKDVEVRVLFWAPDIRSQVFVKACKTPVKLLNNTFNWLRLFVLVRHQSQSSGGFFGGYSKKAKMRGASPKCYLGLFCIYWQFSVGLEMQWL